jgi:invasion protein IalB
LTLKRGSTLTVTFQNLAKQPIVVPVTLVGFTAAFAKIE